VSWPIRQLGEVADTALGKMLDNGNSKGLPRVPYLRNVNVQWGRIDTDDLLAMELSDDERDRFAVTDGDLLVCEGGEIGRCAIWHGRDEYLAYQKALHRVRPSAALDVKFLLYLMEHYAKTGVLTKLATGSTIAHLPQQQLRRVSVPVPPRDEQRRIVEILEDHLSRLAAAQQAAADAGRRVASMWQSALHTEITGPTVRLAELATDARYGTSLKCTTSGGGLPVVRIPNLVAGGIDLSDEKRAEDTTADLTKLLLKTGDVLIVRTNGSKDLIGRSAVVYRDWVAAFASYLIRYRVNPSKVVPRWVHFALESPDVRARIERMAASSAGQHNLGLKKLDSLLLPCPSIELQSAKLIRLQEIADSRAQLASAIETAQKGATALRQAVLAAAFSGKLTGHQTDQEVIEELADVRSSRSGTAVTA
jgi:type I restriction enzyme S subunit